MVYIYDKAYSVLVIGGAVCFAALLGIFIMIKLILIKDYSIILKVDALAHNSVKLV